MLSKRRTVALILGTLALLMISAVWVKDATPFGTGEARDVALADATPRMQAVMSVARTGDTAIYSITLKNIGDVDIKDIFIAGAIAEGSTFLEAGANPAKGGFRGIEAGNVVFLSDGVPARTSQGPFVYKVKLSGDAADRVWAWVHWQLPGDGTTLSAPIKVLPSVTAALLVSGPAGRLPQGPLFFEVFESLFPPQFAGPASVIPNARVFYHFEGVSSITGDGVTTSFGPGSYGFIRGGGSVRANANTGDVPARGLVFTYDTVGQRDRTLGSQNERRFLSEELKGLRDAPYNLLLIQAEWQPGGVSTPHHHPGPGVVYVLEGTLTHTERGATLTYGPGTFWLEETGEPNTTKNIGNTMAKVIAVFLIPEGEPSATFLEEPHPWLFR